MKYIFLSTLLLIASVCDAQQRRRPRNYEPFTQLEEAKSHLKQQEAADRFSGTVLLSQNGEIKLHEAYGYADKAQGRKNNLNTKINIGSLNKAFTGLSVLQLFDQGKLKLDDPVVKYIPELKMPMADQITIRHLLQMKSGLGSYFAHPDYVANRHLLTKMEGYLPLIQNEALSFEPGKGRQYSNSGYELLGILVERVSGHDYYDYVKQNVFEKTGMKHTGFFNRHKLDDTQARAYTRYKEDEGLGSLPPNSTRKFDQDATLRHAVKGTGAGGGYSTVEDLYRFVTQVRSGNLISDKAKRLFFDRYEDKGELNTFYRAAGGSVGINAQVVADFSKNYICVVLSNYDPNTASDMAGRLAKTAEVGNL